MSEWTRAARELADDLLRRHESRFSAEGADAAEVVADLRSHLELEVARQGLSVVTEEDVWRILGTLDPGLLSPPPPRDPEAGKEPPLAQEISAPAEVVLPTLLGGFARLLLFLGAVVLPVITLLFEVNTHALASEFLDPVPTSLHVVLIALVPLTAALALVRLNRGSGPVPAWMRWMVSFSIGVSGLYALFLLPLLPFAVVAILFLGLGFIPLGPLLSWISLLVISRRLRRLDVAAGIQRRHLWAGWVVAGFLVAGLAAPQFLTRLWSRDAVAGSEEQRGSAVRLLRRFGSDSLLLQNAYGKAGRSAGDWFGMRSITPEEAQVLYFRVTGRAFNEVRPPLSSVRGSGRAVLEEFDWDSSLGGEAVGGRLSGLSLASSRLDGMAHAADGWGYTEWTFEFRNDHEWQQREARAVLQLPPGGVVSRVTLWVNGEEREAAFAGRSQARKAYQEVAVVQRRDPILVTTAGPDRVLMQCFPVPQKGGLMRVRLGITAPLEPVSMDRVTYLWPRIAEANFAIREDLRHHAWLEIPDGSAQPSEGWNRDADRTQTLHATVSHTEFSGRLGPRMLGRAVASPAGSWVKDDRGSEPAWFRRTLEPSPVQPPGRIALVLEGGLKGEETREAVRKAFAASPGSGRFAVWFVRDGAQRWPSESMLGSRSEVAAALAGWHEPFNGGHDPLPALEAAWDWAAAEPGGTVLWFHRALPVHFETTAGLRQRLERSGLASVRIIDMDVQAGPDRITSDLPETPARRTLARTATLDLDLLRLLDQLDGSAPALRWVTTRTTSDPGAPGSASRHVIRLWARGEAASLAAARKVSEAIELAARWQLVTPVSGAVVLETRQQFAQNGLEPVDPVSAPGVVPEPEAWMLMVVGTAALLWQARRRNRTDQSQAGKGEGASR